MKTYLPEVIAVITCICRVPIRFCGLVEGTILTKNPLSTTSVTEQMQWRNCCLKGV